MAFNRKKFFEGYRFAWGKVEQSQVEALEFLLSKFEADPIWKRVHHIAYALATIKHETADTFRPITEYGGKKYFDKYDTGRLAKRLGNTPEADKDGYLFRGRGYVQLTGRRNYRLFEIEDNPDRALEPETAFLIMTTGMFAGVYTGKAFKHFIHAQKVNYVKARAIINGDDDADLIATYAHTFEKILKDSAAAVASPNPATTLSEIVQSVADNSSDRAPQQPNTETKVTETVEEPQKTVSTEQTVTTPKGDPPEAPATKVTKNGPLAKWLFGSGGLLSVGTLVWSFVQSNSSAAVMALICVTVLIIALIYRGAITDAIRMEVSADPERKNVT